MKPIFIITEYLSNNKNLEASQIKNDQFFKSKKEAEREFIAIITRLKEHNPKDETRHEDDYSCTIGDTFMRYAIKKLFNGLPE